MTSEAFITIDGGETHLVVDHHYYPAGCGHRDRWGAPGEPDEPAYIQIERVVNRETGEEIELSDDDAEKVSTIILSQLANDFVEEWRDYARN